MVLLEGLQKSRATGDKKKNQVHLDHSIYVQLEYY